MARYTLPILFLNLSGEMIYILDQRLKAQQVSAEKAKKVLNDIASIMLNQRFLEEIFKPQQVYNKDALRSVFYDLAHSSIMRLNEESMGKLYDLMRMVSKYQVFAASEPKDMLLITLNHLDQMRNIVASQVVNKQVDSAYFLLVKTYGQMSSGELQRLRYHILNFFQDMRIRVSIFMRQGLQNSCGSFIINPNFEISQGNEIPGSIRVYGTNNCVEDLLSFTSGGVYTVSSKVGSLELQGARHTTLGTNIYSPAGVVENDSWDRSDTEECEKYRQELNLLVRQLRGSQLQSSKEEVTLDLIFDQDGYSRDSEVSVAQIVSNTETEPFYTESLHQVMTEMSTSDLTRSESSNTNVVELLDSFL